MIFFEHQQFQKNNTFKSNNSGISILLLFFCPNFPVEHMISSGIGHQFQQFFSPGDLRRLGAYSLGCFRGVCVL